MARFYTAFAGGSCGCDCICSFDELPQKRGN